MNSAGIRWLWGGLVSNLMRMGEVLRYGLWRHHLGAPRAHESVVRLMDGRLGPSRADHAVTSHANWRHRQRFTLTRTRTEHLRGALWDRRRPH